MVALRYAVAQNRRLIFAQVAQGALGAATMDTAVPVLAPTATQPRLERKKIGFVSH